MRFLMLAVAVCMAGPAWAADKPDAARKARVSLVLAEVTPEKKADPERCARVAAALAGKPKAACDCGAGCKCGPACDGEDCPPAKASILPDLVTGPVSNVALTGGGGTLNGRPTTVALQTLTLKVGDEAVTLTGRAKLSIDGRAATPAEVFWWNAAQPGGSATLTRENGRAVAVAFASPAAAVVQPVAQPAVTCVNGRCYAR